MTSTMKALRLTLGLSPVLFLGLYTGCQTTTASGDQPVVRKQQTTYTGTGTWIPRKVKKKSDLIGDQTTVTSGEALERANRAGLTRVPKGK